jgi:exo-1,4-beta-D-glucosaminidase
MVAGSLKKMMPADQIWPPNEYWQFHSGSGDFQNLSAFDDAMNQIYGTAKDLEDYERKAQAMAYENERAMYEAYARNKYASTGVIQWMLNNAWPSLIWHLYDYYLQPAGGYFGAKEANELLHIQYSYDDRSVVVVNSYYHPFPGLTISADLYDFNLKPIFSRRSSVDVAADSSQRILTIPPFPQTASPETYFLKLDLRDRSGKSLSSNFYWLSSKQPVFEWNWTTYERTEEYSYQDLTMLTQLPSVKLDATANRDSTSSTEVSVRLRNPSDHLAFQVRLAINDANGNEILPVLWSDNYTELMPAESRIVTARYPSWISLPPGAKLEVTGWNIEPVTIDIDSSRSAVENHAPAAAKAAFH